MDSVADALRRNLARTGVPDGVTERVLLALELGDQDLELFRSARGLDRGNALKELRRLRQNGRTPCVFFEPEP